MFYKSALCRIETVKDIFIQTEMHSFKFLAHYNIKSLTIISMSYILYEPKSLIKCSQTECKAIL